MNSEAWTLIGVVVGALATGGAPVLTARFGRKNAERDRAYNELHGACVDFLDALASLVLKVQHYFRSPLDPATGAALSDAQDRVNLAMARLALSAPDDLFNIAQDLDSTVEDLMQEQSAPPAPVIVATVGTLEKRRDDFARVAREALRDAARGRRRRR